MFNRTKICTAALAAIGSSLALVGSAIAQEVQRVEITGSAIKRLDAETAVPVTIVKMDALREQGVTTVEQVIANLSAVQVQIGTNFSVGCTNCQGAAFADLRGIGKSKTLILLNGRRLANNAADGSAADLNTIPFAAIERVEVLRDGASALYGTDAIGGVINFITRKDYTGGTITVGATSPQHAGGKSTSGNIGFGFGDLDKQGFNVFGFIDVQAQKNISGSQRDFNSRIPGGLSGSTSPANYFQSGTVVGNPSGPSCATGTFLIPNGDGSSCTMTTSKFVDYVPKSDRQSGMLKGTVKLGDAAQLGLEFFATKTDVWTLIAPVPYGALIQNPFLPDGTTPNPYYPGNAGNSFAPAFVLDPNYTTSKVGTKFGAGGNVIQKGFVNVKWRDLPNGPRGDKNVNNQQHFVASLDGTAASWDYQVAASYNTNKVDQFLTSGYNNGPSIQQGVLTGIINPYGAQSAAGAAFIANALDTGLLQTSKGTVTGIDGHASRDMGDWFGSGRQAALALGAEYRREDFRNAANTDFATLVVASTGLDPTTVNAGKRNVMAAYAELNVPITKSFEVTGAARYDKYSDFGNTTNPKVSFRFQPIQQVLLRGSYSTGFRAPTLYELNGSQAYGNTGSENNPFTCPGGTPVAGTTKVNNCGAQFEGLFGGNNQLKPEKSKSGTLGIVLEPMADTSIALDFWTIKLTQAIGSISETTLFGAGATTTFASYFHPLPDKSLSTDGTLCPGATCGWVDLRTNNLGGTNTSGIDISAAYKLRLGGAGALAFALNSTYVSKYEYQDFAGGPWNQNVGVFSGQGPIFRWQHNFNVNWALDSVSLGLAVHNKSGYVDENPSNTVAAYTTVDLYGTWSPLKELSLTLGVRNLSDKAPPFTNQNLNFQGGGWDSRFADPTGRAYYARVGYKF